MTWPISLFTALLGAVAGFFGMAGIGVQWVRWFRISSFEGGSGYVVFYLAILGGIGGGIVAFVASRYAVEGGDAHFVKGLGYAAAAIAAILAVVYAVVWTISDQPPQLDGRRLLIELEIRTPPVTPLLEQSGYLPGVSLFNSRQKARGFNTDLGSTVRTEGNQRVVNTRITLGSSDATKYLYVAWSKGCQFEIKPSIPGKPKQSAFEWSEWQDVSMISPDGDWAKPGVDLRFVARYRVQFVPSAPAPPTDAERAAQEAADSAAAEQAQREKLAAIPEGAPVAAFLEFTGSNAPAAIKRDALARMRATANFAQEYLALVTQPNGDSAAAWMRLAQTLPDDRAPVIAAVRVAGEDVARRLGALSRYQPNSEALSYAGYDVLVRFGGFFTAAFELREAGSGDFTPELRAILRAARLRQDVPGVRSDIVRVASYHLQQWAGDAPLPNDPPPK